jgi:hypothetical protein
MAGLVRVRHTRFWQPSVRVAHTRVAGRQGAIFAQFGLAGGRSQRGKRSRMASDRELPQLIALRGLSSAATAATSNDSSVACA